MLTAHSLLLSRQAARLNGARGINGIGAFIDVANDAVFVDHKRNAIGKEAGEIEDTVSLGHLLFGVGKQWKRGAGFLGKLAVPVLAVEADPQNLRARSFEPGDITLIRLDLFRSTGRGGANIEGQDHGFLAAKIRELDDLAILVRQLEIRGAVTHLQSRRCAQQGHKEYAQQESGRELFCHMHRRNSLVTCHSSRPFYCPLRCSRKLRGVAFCKDGVVSQPEYDYTPKA